MYCQFFGKYYYTAIYPGAFGSHKFPYRSLLLSTTVLNESTVVLNDKGKVYLLLFIHYMDHGFSCYVCPVDGPSSLEAVFQCMASSHLYLGITG